MKTTTRNFTKKLREMYHIEVTREEIHIHEPAYINIARDNDFQIVNGETSLRIYNNKVVVSLWKDITNMHVTVLD